MSKNKVSVKITPEKVAAVNDLLDKLTGEFDFTVGLVSQDRKGLPKMGRKHLDLVDRSLKYAENKPEYLPNYLPLEEFKKDIDLYGWLRQVQKKLGLLSNNLKTTSMVAESEAYETARIYYNNAKLAARGGDENAEVIANELAVHFKKKSKKENTTPTTPNPPQEKTEKPVV